MSLSVDRALIATADSAAAPSHAAENGSLWKAVRTVAISSS